MRRLFRPRPARTAGEALYAGLVVQARRPELYRDFGVADRIDARFELYVLHLALLLTRLRGQGEAAAETSQALFDAFVGALDDSLRELGVGDLSVAKKMRKLGEVVYGRTVGYQAALLDDDAQALAGLVARSIFAEDAPGEKANRLAGHALWLHTALAAAPLDAFLKGQAPWPETTP